MICPTDGIESIVRDQLSEQPYFYTSLGNSLRLDEKNLRQISTLIRKERVKNITVILAEDNRIVLDALDKQHYQEIAGLDQAYSHLQEHKYSSHRNWKEFDSNVMILSCHISHKVKQLKTGLENLVPWPLEIRGKLYSRDSHMIYPIYPDLICTKDVCLN